MNSPDFKPSNILFVWDGTANFIRAADRFVGVQENAQVRAVRAMPHESIHSYSTELSEEPETTRFENELRHSFKELVDSSEHLTATELVILFGDRVTEIGRLARSLQADCVLTPRFKQTPFSQWVHGDLDEKLAERCGCSIVFLATTNSVLSEKQKRKEV